MIGVMATALAARMSGSLPPDLIVLVVLACTNVAAFAAGAVFYGLGKFKLGLDALHPLSCHRRLLAGSGLLILMSTVPVLTGLSYSELDWGCSPSRCAWRAGCRPGLRPSAAGDPAALHPCAVVPVLLLGAVVLYHLGLLAAGVHIGEAQAAGLLLAPSPRTTG